MTKEEKIKEAYGEYWDRLDNYQQIEIIDNDGKFYEYDVVKNINSPIFRKIIDSIDCVYDFDNDSLIPLSIENIFNNNGWIKIESEDDLPRESGEYYVFRKFHGDIDRTYAYGDISEMPHTAKSWLHNYTHYQKTVKPKPPIY